MKIKTLIDGLTVFSKKNGIHIHGWWNPDRATYGRQISIPEGIDLYKALEEFTASELAGEGGLVPGLTYTTKGGYNPKAVGSYYRWNEPFGLTKHDKKQKILSNKSHYLTFHVLGWDGYSPEDAISHAYKFWTYLIKEHRLLHQTESFYWFWEKDLNEFVETAKSKGKGYLLSEFGPREFSTIIV